MLNQEAEEGYLQAHETLDAKIAPEQTTANWWDDPPVSTPAAGKPSDTQFVFTFKACQKGSHATKVHVLNYGSRKTGEHIMGIH